MTKVKIARSKVAKTGTKQKAFALVVAVIMAGIFLSVGVAVSTLVSKGLQLSSIGVASQRAFYAADTAFECALYHDSDPETPFYRYSGSLTCAGQNITVWNVGSDRRRFQLSTLTSCAVVNVEAIKHPDFPAVMLTKIVSRGYNVTCNQAVSPPPGLTVVAPPPGLTVVERALEIIY